MKRLLTSRRSFMGGIGIAIATSSIAAAQWPGGEEPSYLVITAHHGQAELKFDTVCPSDAIPQRDWGAAKPRITSQGKLCVRLAPDIDAVRIGPHGGACGTMPGLTATKPTDTVTLNFTTPTATLQGCQISEAGSKPAYGGVAIDFADGYSLASSFHGEAPDIVADNPPGSPAAAIGSHAWRYRVDLHRASADAPALTAAAVPPTAPASLPTKLTPSVEPMVQPAQSVGAAVPASAHTEPASVAPAWATTVGLRFRAQIENWLGQANQGCGTDAAPCFRLAPHDPGDPVEPWRIRMNDTIPGDFLTALAYLRDGFPASPRPDIEVTRNNVIIIHTLGGDR